MRIFTVSVGMFFSITCFSQNHASRPPSIPFTGNELQSTYLTGLISQPLKNLFENRDIKGSPYLSEAYKPGSVKLRNGYTQKNVPVRFNLYTNEIEFKLNEKEMSLDSVDLVVYLDNAMDSSSVRMLKAGYPEINGHNESTIYEVIALGEQAHLIKHTSQRIEERKVMGMPNEKYLENYTALYLFDPATKTIVKVKNAKDQLQSIFPGNAAAIEKIIKEKNLNLKNELELGELVTDLNKLHPKKSV